MVMEKERQLIAEHGRRMVSMGLTQGTGGNLSIFDPESKLFAISPSGMDYDSIRAEDVVVLDLDYHRVDGHRDPSSEFALHGIFYRSRPEDILAVVHVHAVYSSALACMRREIVPLHYIVGFGGGETVRCAEYATYGTPELAQNAFEGMKDRNAVLLANHGMLTGATTIQKALGIASEMEWCARLQCITQAMGSPVLLDSAEMQKNVEKFKSYGINNRQRVE